VPKKNKDQFVIAYIADLGNSGYVVDYARSMARFLKKGLILLFICDKKYTKTTSDEAQQRLSSIKEQFSGEDINFCVLKGRTREIITMLPTLLNAVVIVAGVNPRASLLNPTHPRRVLFDFGQCRTAYLTVQTSNLKPQTINFNDVALRIDYNRESKEKLIWASYFARFNGSRLHVMHETYNDDGLRGKFDNNMLFLDKFFSGLGIGYEKEDLASTANFPDRNAIRQASSKGYDLMVCLTTDTRELDFLDFFIGAQETRTIRNKQKLPVLFINPRDDIYVLCD
jgi:hypothetical protein